MEALDPLTGALRRILDDLCTPALVRAAEAGGDTGALWRALEAAGFADALCPEAAGGSGLGLSEAAALAQVCGACALPLPLSFTQVARAWLAAAGLPAPEGPVTLAGAPARREAGEVRLARVLWVPGSVAVLAEVEGVLRLLPLDRARVHAPGEGVLEADLAWAGADVADAPRLAPVDWRATGACLLAAHVAGAAGRLLQDSLAHVRTRQQFGRALGGFQAVQHQLALMAEEVAAARAAAHLGAAAGGLAADPLRAAVAKARTGEAALEVASAAHALHGALGITAEFHLQLFTRRLHAWRVAFGSESWWEDRLGEALLTAGEAGGALAFVRARVA